MGDLRFQFSCVGAFWRQGLRKTFLVMLAVLAASIVFGYATCLSAPELTTTVVEAFMEAMLDSGVVDETGAISFFGLLLNNWMAILLCVLYGFLPFLFLPAVILFSNAFLVGTMAAYYQISNLSMELFFAGLIPHGVFELPALALAAAMGFILCLTLVRKLLRSRATPPMGELFSDVLRTLLLVTLPLLVAAAAVEAYVTPKVMELFM